MTSKILNFKSNQIDEYYSILTSIILITYVISFIFGNSIVNFTSLILFIFFFTKYQRKKLDFFNLIGIVFLSLALIHSFFFDNESKFEIIKIVKQILFVLVLVNTSLINEKIIIKFSNLLILILVFISIDTIWQYIFDENLFGNVVPNEHKPRLTGPFGDEPVPGSFIAYFSIYVLFNLIEKKRIIILLLITGLFIITILLSGERMALLIFLLNLSLISFFIIKKKIIRFFIFLIFLFIICFIFILITYLSPYVSERVFSILNVLNINNFLNSHYGSHYITGVKIFFENPFFGVGYDNYQFVCNDPLYENNYLYNEQRCSSHLHNLYLQILADFGILIFIIFLLFITYPVYLVVRLFLQYGYFDIKIYKYISYILVLIFPFKTSGDLFSTWYGGVFWFNFAICAGMILKAYRNKY